MSAQPGEPMRTSSATLLTFASQIVQLAAATLTAVLVARLYGPQGKGLVSLVMLSTSLAVTFGGLGVPMYHGCVAGRGDHTLAALRTNSIVCALLGSLGVGVVVVVVWLSGVMSASSVQVVWVLAAVPAGLLMRNIAGIFQGQGRFREYNLLSIVMWIVVCVATTLLGLTIGGVGTALAAWWLGQAVPAALGWWMTRETSATIPGARRQRAGVDTALLRASLKFGLAVWFVQLIGESNLRFDTYVAAFAGGTAGAGYYSVAVSISNLLFHLPVALGTGILPRMATATAAESARLAGVGCRLSLWSSAALAIAVAVLARPLVRLLFGAGFEPAVAPMRLLLPGIVVYALAHVTTSYFYGQAGRPMLNGLVALISLVVGLATSALLAPRYGLAGVAAAVSVGRTVAIMVNIWLFTRLSNCPLVDILLPRPGDLALVLEPVRRLRLFSKPD